MQINLKCKQIREYSRGKKKLLPKLTYDEKENLTRPIAIIHVIYHRIEDTQIDF